MKKYFTAFFLLWVLPVVSNAQSFPQTLFYVGTNAQVKVGATDTLLVKGNVINGNPAGYLTIHNAGHIYLTGDLEDCGKGMFQSSSFSNYSGTDKEIEDVIDSIRPPKSPLVTLKTPRGHIHFVGDKPQVIRSAVDTSIWLANVEVRNTLQLKSSVLVLGTLDLQDSVDINGNSIYHYLYDDFNYVGNWGKLANETETTFVYDSRQDSLGTIRMLKNNNNTYGDADFDDLKTMGLTVDSREHTAGISVARYHSRDMGVTSGSIRKYYDVEKGDRLENSPQLGIRYFNHDFNPAEMSETDFSLFELRKDNKATPKARRLESQVDTTGQRITSSDSIVYIDKGKNGKRYSIAATRCANPPLVSLGADTVLCDGTALLLRASIHEYQPHYEWKKNNVMLRSSITDSTWSAHEAGTYVVRVTDSRGCESIDSIKITLAPNPQPNIIPSHVQRHCESDAFNFAYTDTSGVTLRRLLWEFGDGTTATDSAVTKSYAPVCGAYMVRFTATSEYGCRAKDSIRAEVEQRRLPTIRTVQMQGMLASFVAADMLNSCPPDIIKTTWFVDGDSVATGTFLNNYLFPEYGTYTVEVQMEGLCTAYVQKIIEIKAPGIPYFVHTSGKKDYCVGESVMLINDSEVNSGSFVYNWNFGNKKSTVDSIAPNISYAAAGSYVVTLTMISTTIQGWQQTYVDTIYVHSNPAIHFGGTIFHCKAQYTLIPEDVQSYYSYEWKRGGQVVGTDASYTVNTDGIYMLTSTNTQYGCHTTEDVQVTLNNHLRPQLGTDRAACGSCLLDAHNPGSTYEWNTGERTREINVTESGTYTVYVHDAEGCEGRDTVVITIHAVPAALLGADTYLCNNETMVLRTPGNAAGARYLWSTGATADSIRVGSDGLYSVLVTHANGICTVADTIRIIGRPAPVITFDNVATVCNGQSITLNQYAHAVAELIRWTYPDGHTATGVTTTTNQGGQHKVFVQFANGCSATDSVMVNTGETNAVANFMVSSKANTNDVLQLVNLSYPEPLNYHWEVGGIPFSTEENPLLSLHSGAIWMARDTFFVTLTVDDGGCPATKRKLIIILPQGAVKACDLDTGEEVVMGADTVSITEKYVELLEAALYPNPATGGRFTVETRLTAPATLQTIVLNLQGQIMEKRIIAASTHEFMTFSTTNYPAGVYLVHLLASKKTRLLKVFVHNE